jgi:anti-sigma regulatory factor (Ser/Thr protein kinase)
LRAVREGAEASIRIEPEAPGVARALVTRWLDGHVSAAVVGDACLVVSELVTNSLLHAEATAGAPVRLRAVLMPGVLRLEVADDGRGGDVAQRPPDRDGGGGFGLHIVASVGARWGVENGHGTLVWCELDT